MLHQAAGLYMSLVYNTFMGTVPVLPPSTGPVSADLVIKLAKYARAEVAFLAPSILEEISQTPELLDQLDSFTKVLFSGGPLPKTAGETVKKRARIINVLGATEFGALLTSEVEQEEWDYLSIHPSSHAELRPHAGGLFELVLVRTKSLELYSPVWHMFPDLQEYPTKDLFTKHPTKPNLWRHAGRADDILVLVNGEKVNPIEMEQCISNHPDVRSALVFGEGHLHCALLIEPNSGTLDSMSDKLGMIESIWPSIQRANSDCPAYARIPKSLVAFTGPGKPMQRAGKGTVQRRQTVMDYQSEMDALYAHEKVLTASDTKPVADLSDEHATRAMMVDLVLHVTEWQDLKEEENFFERGMASSHAVRLAGQLKASTGSELIATSTVYRNPSVISLSAAICSLANQDQITGPDKEGSRIAKMQDSLIKFTEHLNAREPGKVENVDKAAQTILLTGTTGAIGSYLLDALLASRSVARIYCLHREPYGEKRQKHSNSARGLATDWDINRVQFLMCDLTMPMLGLNERTYQEIARCVTLIIHNAWNVNMNLPVSAFKSDIRGTRNLVDLAIDSAAQAEIFFVSSIAAVMGWCHHHNGPVPEETFIDHSVSQATGYAESKQVAERLLQKASQASHVPVTICRVGQIAGPVKHAAGQWNTREWVPSLIASSKHLGMLPATLGKMEYVDWIPIDVLPQIIMELAFTQTKSNTSVNVYHAVNPSKAKWEDFLPVILRQLGHGTKIVSLQEWIQALMKSSAMPDLDLSANPAVKLLDFLSALGDENAPPTPEMQVDNTVEHSRTLKDLGPVNAAWMEKWLHQWGY